MILLLQRGALKVMCQHIAQKKNSEVWYYRRRVPEDVRKLHIDPATKKPKAQLFFSLKTADKREACRLADTETRRLDSLWKAFREGAGEVADPAVSLARLKAAGLAPGDGLTGVDAYGMHLPPVDDFILSIIGEVDMGEERRPLSKQDSLTLSILHGASVPKTLMDVKDLYCSLGHAPRNKVAQGQFDRAWNLLLEICGDKVVTDLKRADANAFVERLIKSGVGESTIKKYIAQISPAVAMAIRELELTLRNPFEKLSIALDDEGQRKPRFPFSQIQLKNIWAKCAEVDDPRRWVIAMLSDSGARLSEVLGLEQRDVVLDAPVPHIIIRPNGVRRIKNDGSQRSVPLVGMALWGAQRAMAAEGQWLFPSLLPKELGRDFSSGAVSSTLNKWMKENRLSEQGNTLHSFRHSVADRLREVEVPDELLKRITGWTVKGMAGVYGQGYSLEKMQEYMLKIVSSAQLSEPVSARS